MGRGPWRTVHGTGLRPSDRALDKLMDVLPHERWRRIVNIVNHEKLAQAGLETRFGPDWPGRRCGARTRSGGTCKNPAIKGRSRCKLHGGLSSGPKSVAGKARAARVHTKHGRRSRAHVEKVRAINAEIKRISLELKRDRFIP